MGQFRLKTLLLVMTCIAVIVPMAIPFFQESRPAGIELFMLDTPTNSSNGWNESDAVVRELARNGIDCNPMSASLGTRHFAVSSGKFDAAKKFAIKISKTNRTTIRLKSKVDSDEWETYESGNLINSESYKAR